MLNCEPLRTSYNACLPLLSAYHTDLAQNEALYKAYRAIREREEHVLGPVERRVVEHTLRDFHLAGVGLDAERKQRFKNVLLELTQLQSKFEENVLDATNAWSHHVTDEAELAGLNETIVAQGRSRAHAERREGWVLTLDQPTYVAVVTDAESQSLRRAFYEAWNTRASDQGPSAGRWNNTQVMEDILSRRHEAAQLLGFKSYAEYALAKRMARSVEEVLKFLQELAHTARATAEREFAELTAFAGRPLEAWDVGFYAERLQRSRYAVSQEELRPYFCMPRVLTGLFDVAERLFDIRIRSRDGVALWHPDVRFFEIADAGGHAIGSFYLDAYARANKRSGAWMDECIGRKHLTAGSTTRVSPASMAWPGTRSSCPANSSRITPGSPMYCSAFPATSRAAPRCPRNCRTA